MSEAKAGTQTPEVPQEVLRIVAKQQAEDAAAHEALASPLPGPLRDAFSPDQSIRAGQWTVGPFRDCHYEWLSVLEHPLERIRTREFVAQATGKPTWVVDDGLWERAKVECTGKLASQKLKPEQVDWIQFWTDVEVVYSKSGGKRREMSIADVYIPRGPTMWQLAWIVTREPKVVRAKFKEGLQAVKDAAEQEFSVCTMTELFQLFQAVEKQMEIYWSTAIQHEEDTTGREGGAAADAPRDPTPASSAARRTV